MPSIKGTSSVADPRARSKALKSTKFPSIFSKPINLAKVNKPVLTQWIEQKITSILGFDDEIVSSTAINLFLPSECGSCPDPRRAQLDLAGFLGDDESASFAKEVWSLLLEAQANSSGIPQTLLDQKKKELSQKALPRLPPNMQAASNNRNPEMNRFVQEAARRAHVAREIVDVHHVPPPAAEPPAVAGLPNVPVPIPVSPPLPSDHFSRNTREDDRKMSPLDQFGRKSRPRTPPFVGRDHDQMASSGRYENRQRRSNDTGLSSKSGGRRSEERATRRASWSRSPERSRWREGDSRQRRDSRERRRQYDEDDEIRELEARLSDLKRQFAKRREDRDLDDEIEDVEDRIYELERRRRRARRRDEEEYNHRKRRRRSSPPERAPERHRRSRSSDSEDSRRRHRSRSPDKRDRDRQEAKSEGKRDRRSRSSSSSSSSSSSASSYSSSSESDSSSRSK